MTPELWQVEDGHPRLRGVRCLDCGAVLFPPQRYGCEACGADGDRLVEAPIEAEGTLHSFTTVHLHPTEPTPFQVGEVATSAGPLVQVRLRHPDPVVDARVVGRATGEGEARLLEFVKEGG